VPIDSYNYSVQIVFSLAYKQVGAKRRFKVRLDAANEALRANDLDETKRLIQELDKRKQFNNMELFLFAMLEAATTAIVRQIVEFLEAHHSSIHPQNLKSVQTGRNVSVNIINILPTQ
jgi:hypothetical protein